MSQDVVVKAGETVILSPDSSSFKASVKQYKPKTIEEVRNLLGITLKPTVKTPVVQSAVLLHPDLKSVVFAAADLKSKVLETKRSATKFAYAAAKQYVQSADVSNMAHLTPVMDQYILNSNVLLNIFQFGNIEIANGGTLQVSKNTHAIYANAIKMHGTGKIVCKGAVSIHATTVQGKL